MKRVGILLFYLVGWLLQDGKAQIDSFVLPLKQAPVMSGSFAELRSNHFHSGVDFTTLGRVGVPVYASAGGFVSRVKISAGGYGKAVYLEHSNGTTTVYAHLERFAPRLDSLVRKQQYAKESFEIEWQLGRDEIRFEQGELLAFSGNSGSSGGPHLHFEIRDTETQDPLQPLGLLNGIPDQVAPVIHGIKLYPLSAYSKIGAGTESFYYTAIPGQDGFTLKDRSHIVAAGKIGVAVHVTDYFSNNSRRCGVSKIRLFEDDRLIFHADLNRFSFAETRYINSYIDYAERHQRKRFLQKSFLDPNNRLSMIQKAEELSIQLGEEKKMRYEVEDASGNTSRLEFVIKGSEPFKDAVKPKAGLHRAGWRMAWSVDTAGYRAYVAPESFYKDEYLNVDLIALQGFENRVFVLGNEAIPVHEQVEITLPVPAKWHNCLTKVYIAQVKPDGKTQHLGGVVRNQSIVTRIRNLGRFTVLMDHTPPSVQIRPPAGKGTPAKILHIHLRDAQSGISTYRVEIGGKWQLFEYDSKTDTLLGDLSQMKLTRGKNYPIKIQVTDWCGNQKTVEEVISY